ncbi:uncharacterized protein VTP21DRAFT_223 [Calcarisporiella thermophila]|uniref:uncharacterized protein n=1 Tax=Calcarisporiella thermophila TaxID=911321 RepID=UPI003742F2ED
MASIENGRKLRLAISFICAVIGMASAGTLYMFGLYSNSLADKLNYSQTQTSTIGLVGDIGGFILSPLVGSGVDRLGHRRVCVLAAIFLSSGYIAMALTYNAGLATTSFIAMSLYFALVGLGSNCAYMASVSAQAKNFSSQHRGIALGVPIGAYGLSAFIWSQIGRVFFFKDGDLDTYAFLFFMGLVTAGINLVNVVGLAKVRTPTATAEEEEGEVSGTNDSANLAGQRLEEGAPLLQDPATSMEGAHVTIDSPNMIEDADSKISIEDRPFFADVGMWVFITGLTMLSGSGMLYINSIGSIVEALYGKAVETGITDLDSLSGNHTVAALTTLHVSLISACSCSGRVLAGIVSDWAKRRGIDRLWFFILAGCIMTYGQFLAATTIAPGNNSLLMVTLLIGTAYGTIFTVSPTITTELWGLRNFGRNWGWMSWAPGIGGMLFNLVFGVVFDSRSGGPGKRCHEGRSCFAPALYLTTLASLAGIIMGVLMLCYVRVNRAHYTPLTENRA